MPSFSLRNPYTIIVGALVIVILGVTAFIRMAVDVFPNIKIPAVVVATFYQGMPPLDMEDNITFRYERFFTLGSNIEHVESRSLSGVSIIKVFFQPGTDIEAAAAQMGTLAMADLGIMPPGNAAPAGAAVRRVVAAGSVGDGRGQGLWRDPTRRSGPLQHPQSTRHGARGLGADPVRGQIPPGHGLRQPAGAAGARPIADGRRPGSRPIQSDLAGRRRKAWRARITISIPTA